MSRLNWKKFFIGVSLKGFNNSALHIPQEFASNIESSISQVRLNTYKKSNNNLNRAICLYLWNANISSSFLFPIHIYEVTVRNAISNALTIVYGDKWPWNNNFLRSLPCNKKGYSPRCDLIQVTKKMTFTSKVIPELKFIFWQNMFTKKHDTRIWNNNLFQVMPNITKKGSISYIRSNIYKNMEIIRNLRNRISHHEPIFNRNLQEDYNNIILLINFINPKMASWVDDNQLVTTYLKNKPK